MERISAQHGASIPHFDKETVFFLLKIRTRDGIEEMLYADTEMQDVMSAHEAIKNYLKL
ncbi:MAG: hypothetical protein OHK006_04080 [Thermodesulfovibrionales bacterium]